MKPNKDIDFNKFVEWSENLCNKRHDKLVELRKKKAGNNPFKKWFYLGKKVKSTVYKVTAFVVNTNEKVTIDTFTRKYEAENFIKSNWGEEAYSLKYLRDIYDWNCQEVSTLNWKAKKIEF